MNLVGEFMFESFWSHHEFNFIPSAGKLPVVAHWYHFERHDLEMITSELLFERLISFDVTR